MDLLTNPLEANPSFIQKYVIGLLIIGDYLELSFFIARSKEVNHVLYRFLIRLS